MRKSIFGKLSSADMGIAGGLGRARSLQSTGLGAKNKQLDWSRSNIEIHTQGAAGEIAFSRELGLEPDLRLHPEGRHPDQYVGGLRFDVKATCHPRGRLMVYIPRSDRENLYENVDAFACCRLLMWPSGDYELTGWAFKGEVCRPENVENVGKGPTWFLADKLLRDFAELKAIA